MSDTKVFAFPDGMMGGGSGNTGLDPNLLLALNNGGGFGGNGNWMWILFLFFLYPFMRNGMFGNGWGNGDGNGFAGSGTGYLANLESNAAGRELLMQAINGNGDAIRQLSSMTGCKLDSVQQAINNVSSQICEVGNKVGMGFQQTINAVQAGNTQLGMQIAQCCCDLRSQLSSCCCDIQRDIATTNAGVERGFSAIGYALRDQTCNLEKAISDSTSQILAGQRAAEMREMQDKIDGLREKNSQQAVIINNAQQTQVFGQMIGQATQPIANAVNALRADVDGIKCKLPETVTLPYSCATAVPTNAVYGNWGFGWNGWNNWNNGCCGNSLWG